jgi:hypothetical protein
VSERLRLDLAAIIERCPKNWGIAQLDGAIEDEIPEYYDEWRLATLIYARWAMPYGDSPHGLYRSFRERRG